MINFINIFQIESAGILPFRSLFLQETNFQIRYNAYHEHGWSDSYLIKNDYVIIDYGSVKNIAEL